MYSFWPCLPLLDYGPISPRIKRKLFAFPLLILIRVGLDDRKEPEGASFVYADWPESIPFFWSPMDQILLLPSLETGFFNKKRWMSGNGWGRGQVHPFVLSSWELLPSLTSSARLVGFCVLTSNPDQFDKTRSINNPRPNICLYELAINRRTSFCLPLLGIFLR